MKIRHLEIRNFRGIKSLSWHVKGDFNCIIGAGDSCKTTILTALDYALSPRITLTLDDADFFNQDVTQDIVIQVTLAEWDESELETQEFFRESKFAQYKCGLTETGPVPEPQPNGVVAISLSLRIDKSLEPKWSIVKGRDEGEEQEKKSIYAVDRAALKLSRLDLFSDFQFSWGRNTILTRLSSENTVNLNSVLSTLAREMRQSNVLAHESIVACQTIADTIKQEAQDTGVKLANLSPKIDVQRQSMTAGAISLHDNHVPLRHKGNGSKRLIAAAMQIKLHGGKNIALIDELEVGLEPHRIRGLIQRLRKSNQQIFTTTHSPVVIRELNIENSELYVCRRDIAGTVTLESMGTVPGIQGQVRTNAEAFLGSKIIACEGLTEIGCLRAYDLYRWDDENPPVWTFATSYFNCGGGGNIKVVSPKLLQLGYKTAVVCDNDSEDQLSVEEVEGLKSAGIHVCQWTKGNSTERQLLAELPWNKVPELLSVISQSHDSLQLTTIIDFIRKDSRIASQNLSNVPADWSESVLLREVIGDLTNKRDWIKRIHYASEVFKFALPHLPNDGILKSQLASLWTWVQVNE
jgi:putative ATP-dependent endonuclease of OLD family